MLIYSRFWTVWGYQRWLNPGGHAMPRTARSCLGGYSYHVLNRGNARAIVFQKPDGSDAFLDLMAESSVRTPMRILAYCLMPNHFHLALWPREDGDVSRWMHWLMTTHVRRHLGRYRSSGHVWQGRFKAFPIQEDEHLLAVLRYIERNPLPAGLVGRAEEWPWSSLRWLAAPMRLRGVCLCFWLLSCNLKGHAAQGWSDRGRL